MVSHCIECFIALKANFKRVYNYIIIKMKPASSEFSANFSSMINLHIHSRSHLTFTIVPGGGIQLLLSPFYRW